MNFNTYLYYTAERYYNMMKMMKQSERLTPKEYGILLKKRRTTKKRKRK